MSGKDNVLHVLEDGAVLMSSGQVLRADDVEDDDSFILDVEVTEEFGVFNDAEIWNPLFASGELPEALREVLVDRPLFAGEILREVVQRARLFNEERAERNELDKIGHVVVRTRTVSRTRWSDVSYDDQAAALGEV